MELKPVKSYRKPRYPEKYIILEDPELLKNIPNRWKKNTYVCIAASTLLAICLSGCENPEQRKLVVDSIYSASLESTPTTENVTVNSSMSSNTPINTPINTVLDNKSNIPLHTLSITKSNTPGKIPTSTPKEKAKEKTKEKTKVKSVRSLIPPVFEHGDGIGVFGGFSMGDTELLTEEEAFMVISDEAKKYGIKFIQDDLVIKDMEIPSTKLNPTGNNSKKSDSVKGNLSVDGYDKLKKIGFEFVSEDDYVSWKSKDKISGTAISYNTHNAAMVLREGLEKKKADAAIGVFYDPIKSYSQSNETGKDSADELREQVKDFISWLKAQSII